MIRTVLVLSALFICPRSFASGEAPGWYRYPSASSGTIVATGEGESKHEALARALIELGLKLENAKLPPPLSMSTTADGLPYSETTKGFNAATIGHTHFSVLNKNYVQRPQLGGEDLGEADSADLSDTLKATFHPREEESLQLKFYERIDQADGKILHDRQLSVTATKTRLGDLVADLRQAGVEIRTLETPLKYFVLLSYRPHETPRPSARPKAGELPQWCRREGRTAGTVTGLGVGDSKLDAVPLALAAAIRNDPGLAPQNAAAPGVAVSSVAAVFGGITVLADREPVKDERGRLRTGVTVGGLLGPELEVDLTGPSGVPEGSEMLLAGGKWINDLLAELNKTGVTVLTYEGDDRYCAQVSYPEKTARSESESKP